MPAGPGSISTPPRRRKSKPCSGALLPSRPRSFAEPCRRSAVDYAGMPATAPRVLLLARTRQFDRYTAAHALALLVDPLRDREVSCRRAVIVGMERDLPLAGPARKRSIDDLAKLVDLVPADDPL